MRTPLLVVICILAGCLAGAGSAFLLVENGVDDNSLNENRDLQASLDRSHERLSAMESRLDAMAKRVLQSPGVDAEALRRMAKDHRQDLEGIRNELASLKAARPAAGATEMLAASGNNEAIAAALNQYVEQAMVKRDKERKEIERKRFAPFIRAQMESQLKRTAKKLKLRPDQEERFEESVRASMDTVMPAIGIVMDPSAKRDEKVQAFSQIDTAMQTVDQDAQSYMDPQQYETFSQEQARQNQQMQRMRSMFGGGTGPTSGGSNSGN